MSKIYDAQDRITSLLTADAYFTDPDPTKVIPVLSQRKGDLAREIQAQIQSLGIGVVVMLPKLTFEGAAQRILLGLVFVVVVSEDPTINLTGKPAEDVMAKVIELIHWQPNNATPAGSIAQHTKFQLDKQAAQLAEPTKAMPTVLNYVIRFNTCINLP